MHRHCFLDHILTQNAPQNLSNSTFQLSNITMNHNSSQLSSEKKASSESYFKKGKIFKKGDGPINYDWNERYAILDGMNFIYFDSIISLSTPKNTIFLNNAVVERVYDKERPNCFSISVDSKVYFFSGLNERDNDDWILLI